jgi:Uma2 family endonuclease
MRTILGDDLDKFSQQYPGYRVERDAGGRIIMSPTRSKTGPKSIKAARQLDEYADRVGGVACDSSTGFAIGPGAEVRSPDASWISQARLDALTDEQYDGFWPLSPDVVVEIKSASDTWDETIVAVDRFMARGSSYGIAINPETREVIRRGSPPPGLALDVDAVIDAGERTRPR